MQRRKFILSSVVAVSSSSYLQARTHNERPNKGFLVKNGESHVQRRVYMRGQTSFVDVKVSKDDTDKDLTVLEVTTNRALYATPLHVHHSQDETFYILEGEYIFQLQKERFELQRGDTIFLPRTIAHAWLQKSEKGKMLAIVQPSGKIEEFVLALGAIVQQPTPEQRIKLIDNKKKKQ
jgi:quercetin dioxygenase-like cupin family protein